MAVFTLGGTITMTTDPATGGVVPALSAHDLLAAVPGLDAHPIDLRLREVRRVPSASLDFDDLTALAGAIDRTLAAGASTVWWWCRARTRSRRARSSSTSTTVMTSRSW
ncbi:asparaginase domain-containing protein [Streptomyces sp. NBC_00582]|uniref:asparaginase domain-containing protein n=1 Tax=Streptomyces sp. NBC_00582 TaxID=2975783 RepID=UPI002E81F39E|nr:asparaginase domain-containing protein [Streptomyces sp. NBC_00582]WUB66928.1 asparaginase domain-containing protein [Streptomyces sp. NBC_00582]